MKKIMLFGLILNVMFLQLSHLNFYCENDFSNRIDNRININNEVSNGLEYKLLDDESGYSVVGLGECVDNEIVIPSTYNNKPVLEIGSDAFYSFADEDKNIVSVKIMEGLKKIGNTAFFGCKKLKEIDLPESLEYIGESAFSLCESLVSIKLPQKIKIIEAGTFRMCKRLKNIDLPNELLKIGDEAFSYCFSLDNILLPDGLEYIGNKVFSNCISLKEIIIPDSVKQVENGYNMYGLFSNCISLEKVVLSKNITNIHESTFAGCSSLESINLPENLKNIATYAFCDCKSLKSITLPNGLESIGDNAFSSCKSLTTIGYLPSSLKTIGENAFFDCSNLKTTEYKNCHYLGTKDNEYYALIKIENKNMENIYINDNTCIIADATFKKCQLLKEIKIPYMIENISKDLFSNCESLKKVDLPNNLKKICTGAFQKCISLEEICLPNSLKEIESDAFFMCNKLTYIFIPKNVITFSYIFSSNNIKIVIENNASDYNLKEGFETRYSSTGTSATTIYSNLSKDDVVEINNLIYIKDGDNATIIGTKKREKRIKIEEKVIINGKLYNVTKIGDGAFYSDSILESVVIPNSITSIGSYAFNNCESLNYINIPDGVKEINDFAFANTGINFMYIPKSVTKLGRAFLFDKNYFITKKIFFECNASEIDETIKKGASDWSLRFYYNCSRPNIITDNNFVYEISNNEAKILCLNKKSLIVEIPKKIVANGIEYKITSIGENAFNYSYVIRVYMPNTINICEQDFLCTRSYGRKDNTLKIIYFEKGFNGQMIGSHNYWKGELNFEYYDWN